MVLEVRDARIPFTSANDDLDRIVGPNKARLIVLNKVGSCVTMSYHPCLLRERIHARVVLLFFIYPRLPRTYAQLPFPFYDCLLCTWCTWRNITNSSTLKFPRTRLLRWGCSCKFLRRYPHLRNNIRLVLRYGRYPGFHYHRVKEWLSKIGVNNKKTERNEQPRGGGHDETKTRKKCHQKCKRVGSSLSPVTRSG